MTLPENYLEKVYAGWLGKVIGVRYGAPIEMWSSEEIARFYGELDGYVKHYADFAADDDTNGPMFFVRAIEDYAGQGELSEAQMGETVLNYVPHEHGFFWWGGYGVSAEHTVYRNLASGIPAPQSGSAGVNGTVLSEQIGGQIFVDTWGLIFPGDCRRAASYAAKAASVGWDGNGIYGGMFVAACVSAAFDGGEIEDVIDKALAVIPEDCDYAGMVRGVRQFYHENPENWRDCLAFVKKEYWWDRYQGSCHIIPNGSIIVLALLYGQGEFSRTLNIGNMCGFDTDCNVGNLGSILGVFCGLEGIDSAKWREEINDFQAYSSVLGSLNFTDVASSAVYLTKLACLASGETCPPDWEKLMLPAHRLHFELPGSTQAMRVQVFPESAARTAQAFCGNTDETAASGRRCFKTSIAPFDEHTQAKLFVKTYYEKEDFTDSRYTPSFSPVLYPGQLLSARVKACKESGPLLACLFVTDMHTGMMQQGESVALCEDGWTRLEYRLPPGEDWCVKEAGILLRRDPSCDCAASRRASVYLDDLQWEGDADYRVDFSKEKNWSWTQRQTFTDVSQFTRYKGVWLVENGSLRGYSIDAAECYTGDVIWENYRCEAELIPQSGDWHGLNIRVQGVVRSYALALVENNRLALLKKEGFSYRELKSITFPWEKGSSYRLALEVSQGRLLAYAEGNLVFSVTDEKQPYQRGAVGLSIGGRGSCIYRNLRVSPCRKDDM